MAAGYTAQGKDPLDSGSCASLSQVAFGRSGMSLCSSSHASSEARKSKSSVKGANGRLCVKIWRVRDNPYLKDIPLAEQLEAQQNERGSGFQRTGWSDIKVPAQCTSSMDIRDQSLLLSPRPLSLIRVPTSHPRV